MNRLARTPVSDTVSMTGGVAQRQEQQQQESRTDGGEALHTLERGVREGFAVPAVVKPESIADIPLPKTLGDKVEGVQVSWRGVLMGGRGGFEGAFGRMEW